MTGEFMHVKPTVIDLGWGDIKSALLNLADKSFVKAAEVKTARQALMDQYVAAFRQVERGVYKDASAALTTLSSTVRTTIAPDDQPAIKKLIDQQIAKL